MLVLTRRPGQSIRFEDLNITVSVLSRRGSMIKLGVDAPREIRVVRGEVPAQETAQQPVAPDAPKEGSELDLHLISNRANRISLAVDLLEMQISTNDRAGASETMEMIRSFAGDMARGDESPEALKEDHQEAANTMHLLVAEDDNEVRNLLTSVLQMNGYSVTAVSDGNEAWDSLQSSKFDAVLVDMVMPNCDGATLVNRLRKDERLSTLPVYAVSGKSPTEFGLEISPAGADRWLPKPISFQHLASALESDRSTSA